jgi:hypothetical protein
MILGPNAFSGYFLDIYGVTWATPVTDTGTPCAVYTFLDSMISVMVDRDSFWRRRHTNKQTNR